MKKLAIILLSGLLIIFSSCKDEIDELFLDPDGSTEAKIEYLFADAIKNNGAGMRVAYNPSGYYLILQGLSPWAQLTGNSQNDAKMMDLVNNGISGSWNAYYGFMSRVAEMEILYNELSDEDKVDYDIYMNLIKIVAANATSKITDLYGDMPYSEAFRARAPDQVIFPKFDSQQSIYTTLLGDLKSASSFLSSFSLNDGMIHSSLATQDHIHNGDIATWIKFSNSLRLRFALRISDVDASLASTTVGEVENGPLVLLNEDNILVDAKEPDGLSVKWMLPKAFQDLQERTYGAELMIDLMNGASDPRRAYHFSTNEDGDYKGVPSSPAEIALIASNIDEDHYSKINDDLVRLNDYLPGVVITASEVNFLLAEAAMKGIGSGDAETFYNTALRQSVDFYYYVVDVNPLATPTAPVTSEVDAFVNSSTFAYDGTIEQLATQKWLHFGILQANEAYTDYRRFDFPVLQENTPEGGGSVLVIPTKVTIPDSEKTRNQENYDVIKANDTQNSKVWWDQN